MLENVTWEEGRFPDRPAMRFHGAGSRGLVNIPVPLTSLTVAAWVKLESFDHKYVSLLMSDGTHERLDLSSSTRELSRKAGGEAAGVAFERRRRRCVGHVSVPGTRRCRAR